MTKHTENAAPRVLTIDELASVAGGGMRDPRAPAAMTLDFPPGPSVSRGLIGL